jgi:hypothetical protein
LHHMRAFFMSHTPRDYGFRGVLWWVFAKAQAVLENASDGKALKFLCKELSP